MVVDDLLQLGSFLRRQRHVIKQNNYKRRWQYATVTEKQLNYEALHLIKLHLLLYAFVASQTSRDNKAASLNGGGKATVNMAELMPDNVLDKSINYQLLYSAKYFLSGEL